MGKQYRDEIAMVCHDMMKSAQSVGAVSDAEMDEFEADCLVQEPETDYSEEKPLKKGGLHHYRLNRLANICHIFNYSSFSFAFSPL